ncbi:MAG TPA: putative baseplate assembly protein [Actinomycetes bacterium]
MSPGADPAGPVLDGRTREQISADLRANLLGYVPELRPRSGQAGDAWVELLASELAVLREGVDRLPERARLQFLERLGAAQLPAQSARAPLTFTLLPTVTTDVTLPARSQVAAKVPPPPPSVLSTGAVTAPTAPVFFTESTVTLTHGALAAAYSVDPASDTYADHSARLAQGFTLFEPAAPMPHRMYLGHSTFLRLAGTAEVQLIVDFASLGLTTTSTRRPILLDWSYLSKDGWLPLTVVSDSTVRFTDDGLIRLTKGPGPDAAEGVIDGVTSYWIRAEVSGRRPSAQIVAPASGSPTAPGQVSVDSGRDLLVGDKVSVTGVEHATVLSAGASTLVLDRVIPGMDPGQVIGLLDSLPPLRPEGTDADGALPEIDQVQLRVGFAKDGLAADQAYADRVPLDLGNVFEPFGPVPALYGTFSLAAKDVFARPGARVSIGVRRPPGHPAATSPPTLAWEYFDGTTWLQFDAPDEFSDTTKALTVDGVISFIAPRGWQEATVEGTKSAWVRARIVSGDYGHPEQVSVVPDGAGYKVVAGPSTLAPPAIAHLTLGYTYLTESQVPEHCVTENDLAFANHTLDCKWPRRTFHPFEPVEDRAPALHLGFTEPLPSGLVSLFTAVSSPGEDDAGPSPFAWEYLSDRGWLQLAVLDESSGLRTSGMIQFVGAADAVARPGLGGAAYWYRARVKEGLERPSRAIDSLLANTVWGRQGESTQDDRLGSSSGEPDQVLVFAPGKTPVLAGERIEVREWVGRGDGWRDAVVGLTEADLRYDTDPATGQVRGVWVRWLQHDHLFGSAPADRHYLIERSVGYVRFGDGVHGRIPSAGCVVRASYAVGGGVAANVPASTITELRTGIAGLQGVTNPVAAQGGTATESFQMTVHRSPQRLRHRDRAVSREDFEWLAYEATPEVARARCLPVTGSSGQVTRGQVTVTIAPWSLDARPAPSVELLSRVRAWLAARIPAGLAGGLHLVSPKYGKLTVRASIATSPDVDPAAVDERLRGQLAAYLHPLTGAKGAGWGFGEPVYLSAIASLVDQVTGVDHIVWIRLSLDGAEAGDVVRLPADALVSSGDHQLTLSLGGER